MEEQIQILWHSVQRDSKHVVTVGHATSLSVAKTDSDTGPETGDHSGQQAMKQGVT